MKELMLCVILVASGALAQKNHHEPDAEEFGAEIVTPELEEETDAGIVTPEPEKESNAKISAVDANLNWGADKCPCCKLCYTQWFDRDDPSGNGDYETLAQLRAQYPGRICKQPFGIQVQTLSGVNAYTTGQVFQNYDTVTGFVCVNKQQRLFKRRCLDYKVRFACPCWKFFTYKEEPVTEMLQ